MFKSTSPEAAGAERSAQLGNAPRSWVIAIIGLAMIAGFVIRYITGGYTLWQDELASMVFASQPLSRLWSAWMVRETNPPMFYSLLHLWLAMGARSILAIRALPELGGVLAIGLVAALCNRISGPWAAVVGALMAMVSAQHVWMSQDLRAYIFETDANLVSMLGLLVWLADERHARAGMATFVLGAAFGFYCHVTLAVWPVAAGLAVAALHGREMLTVRRGNAFEFLVANLALAVLCAWWASIAAQQISSDNILNIPRLTLGGHLKMVWHGTILIRDEPPHTLLLRYVLTVMIAGGSALLLRSRPGQLMVLCWALAVLLFHLGQVAHPIATPFSMFWLSNFSVLALATLVAAVPIVAVRAGLAGMLVATLGWNLAEKLPNFWWEDWRKVITTLRNDPDAILLVEQQKLGMHANWACKVELQVDHCPLPIAVMDSRDQTYAWTREFMDRPLLRRPSLDAVLLRYKRVYVVNVSGPDPLVTLGVIPPHPCCVGFVRGPFSPQALLSGMRLTKDE